MKLSKSYMEKNAVSNYQKYKSTFLLSFWQTAKNIRSMVALAIFLLLSIVIVENIWKGVTLEKEISFHTSAQLLWYITLNNWFLISLPNIHKQIAKEIQSGHIAYLIPRPISYLGSTFGQAIGTFTAKLLFLALIAFLYAFSQTSPMPFHPALLLMSIPFALLAGVVVILFQMIIGFLATSFKDVFYLYFIFEKLCFVLGGLLLPLAAYPSWLLTICNFTPFPSVLGERSALVLNFSLPHVFSLIFSYVGWGAVAFGALLSLHKQTVDFLRIEERIR